MLKVQDVRIVLLLVPNIGLLDPETSDLKCQLSALISYNI